MFLEIDSCLRQDGAVLYVVGGDKQPYTYRLVSFPGGGYSEHASRV